MLGVTTTRGRLLSAGLFISLMMMSAAAAAQHEQKRGDGSLRLEYQYLRTGAFADGSDEFDIGHTDGHTVLLSLSYALSDRLTVTGSLPWVKRRHIGPGVHDPVLDFSAYTPPDLSLIDDGNYHSDFGDFYIGASYIANKGPIQVIPFISFGTPTNDYQFYAHAAVGKGIWHLPVGVAFSYSPPFSEFLFGWDIAYVFTEKNLGVDVSHFLVNASVSYFVTPRFAPRAFIIAKKGFRGLELPRDWEPDFFFDDERWYRHDQIIKHNYVNAGLGFDWVINDKYQLSGSVFKMLDPEQVNIVELAWSLGITHFFSAGSN
ncbi:MAG: transporter [Gammaproteobacteria bacterium]|nr:transporter [Gammaproteobacteria bacterium]